MAFRKSTDTRVMLMHMNANTTLPRPFFWRKGIELALPFRVPREHGAVVCFALSTILAVKLGWRVVDALVLPFFALWLTLMLCHRPRQAFWFGLGAAVALAVLGDSESLAPLIAAFAIGIRVTNTISAALGVVWRELLGMIAVAAMPLLIATLASGADSVGYTATLAYTASALAASLMIHVLRHDSPRLKLFIWSSLFFWMWLWAQEPAALLWCLLPFPPQLLLLLRHEKPSFKLLGIVETAAMLWVSAYLWSIV